MEEAVGVRPYSAVERAGSQPWNGDILGELRFACLCAVPYCTVCSLGLTGQRLQVR